MHHFRSLFELEKIMHVGVVLTQKEGPTLDFNYTYLFSSHSPCLSLKRCLRRIRIECFFFFFPLHLAFRHACMHACVRKHTNTCVRTRARSTGDYHCSNPFYFISLPIVACSLAAGMQMWWVMSRKRH